MAGKKYTGSARVVQEAVVNPTEGEGPLHLGLLAVVGESLCGDIRMGDRDGMVVMVHGTGTSYKAQSGQGGSVSTPSARSSTTVVCPTCTHVQHSFSLRSRVPFPSLGCPFFAFGFGFFSFGEGPSCVWFPFAVLRRMGAVGMVRRLVGVEVSPLGTSPLRVRLDADDRISPASEHSKREEEEAEEDEGVRCRSVFFSFSFRSKKAKIPHSSWTPMEINRCHAA